MVPEEGERVVLTEDFVEGTKVVEGGEATMVAENILLEEREEAEEAGHWENVLCDIHSSGDTHNHGNMLLRHLRRKETQRASAIKEWPVLQTSSDSWGYQMDHRRDSRSSPELLRN